MHGAGALTITAVLFFLLAAVDRASTPLTAVDHVDLTRYVGKWYEIARYPNRFQKKCHSDTTAQYTLLSDGNIDVVNSRRKVSGELTTARGKTKIVDKNSNSNLKVTFFWPFYGDYLDHCLAPDYSYAIVGEPGRKYLWILSRTPQMEESAYAEALQNVQAAGYDPGKLIKTLHSSDK